MRNKSILFYIVLCSQFCFSQTNVNLEIKLSNDFIKEFSYNEDFNAFSKISVGAKTNLKKGSLSALATFGYAYNLKYYNDFLKTSYLGGSLSFRCFQSQNKFSPYFEIEILSELGNRNRGKFLDIDFLYLVKQPVKKDSHYGGQQPLEDKYSSVFYFSVPLIASLTTGCSFQVIKDLNLNLGVGYGLRIMKTKYAEWKENEDVNEILRDKETRTHFFHFLDVQLGLSYAFSFKTKPKKE